MSFILDALRKSEHARQNLGSAALAELPLGRRSRSQPWWIVTIAALLLINLAILAILLFRDNSSKPALTPQPSAQSTPAAASAPIILPPATRVAAQSSAVRPLSEEASPAQVQYETVPRSETPLASAPDGPALVRRIDERPPTAGSVITEAPSTLPEMRIDMHVYAKVPADRFVFINMHKYVEGQTLAEGPVVGEITPDGVILIYKGQQLRLQRP